MLKKLLLTFSILALLFGAVLLYFFINYPTTSPIKAVSYFIQGKVNPHAKMTQQVVGFLPYWRVADIKYIQLQNITSVNYFSLSVDKDGNFIKINGDQTDPGWLNWNSQTVKDLIAQTQLSGAGFSLTVSTQRNKIIENLLDNKNAQQNLIHNIINQVNARHLNNITIDFEYDGDPGDTYRQKFTSFANDLKGSLNKQSPSTTLSLTLLPLAGREKGLFDLAKVNAIFDYFIGMSYDYYAQSSDIAGPVAPMSGFSQNKFFFDVVTTYNDFQKYLPKNKIIMGIPYYGWDWAVQNGSKIQSKTLPSTDPNYYAAVISYARAKEDKDLKPSQCFFDDFAKEPWCYYIDDKQVNHQVWFENTKSIGIKFDYANASKFAGVALWTLGYDKGYPDLWNMIKSDFTLSNNYTTK